LILLGLEAVSAFLSHDIFCAVWLFDSPDAPTAKVLHTRHKDPGNTPDSASSKIFPEFFSVSSGIQLTRNIFAFSLP
jgi:hypothetical protein